MRTERIVWIIAVLVVGAAAFFGGQQLGASSAQQRRSQAAQQFFAQRGGNAQGGQTAGGPGGGQAVAGTVKQVNGQQIVVSTMDGAELTVTLAADATLRKQVDAQLSDIAVDERIVVFGTRDGNNVTANNIQIGGFGGAGGPPPGQQP